MTKKLRRLLIYLSCCFLFGCAINPISGEEELMLVSEQQELTIGQTYAPEIEKQMGGRIDNDILQNYINSVGQKIGRVSHKSELDYHFVALNDEMVNAFALPGGYLFITQGMLKKLQSEAQLAAIWSHEITHVVARHSSAAISRDIGINLAIALALPEDVSGDAIRATQVTTQLVGLKFSRDDEREADMGGLDYMIWSGYDPYAMVETMQMLEDEQETRPPEFLSSHPPPENRIEYLTQRIQTKLKYYNFKGFKVGKEDYGNYVLKYLKNED